MMTTAKKASPFAPSCARLFARNEWTRQERSLRRSVTTRRAHHKDETATQT
jgi:hypothetical protein